MNLSRITPTAQQLLERKHGALRELDLKLIGACRRSQTSSVESLLHRGASPYCKTQSGVVLMHWAAERPKPAVLEVLIAHGCDLSAVDPEDPRRWQPLHRAAILGLAAPCALLVAAKKGLQCPDAFGMTPLHLVCTPKEMKPEAKALSCTEVLLAGGADVNAVSADGNTPLSMAAYAGWTDVFALLIRRGAEVNPDVLSVSAAIRLSQVIANSPKRDTFNAMVSSSLAAGAIEEMMANAANRCPAFHSTRTWKTL